MTDKALRGQLLILLWVLTIVAIELVIAIPILTHRYAS